jgi:peptidoglycan/xylan/chitin deacetylase (PgdA/CDA1 family)
VALAACGAGSGRTGAAGSASPGPTSASPSPSGSASPTGSRGATLTPTRPPTPTAPPTTAHPTSSRTPTRTPTPTVTGLPPWLLGADWTHLPTTAKIVALTFDAGANADATASVLASLAREHVPATFFLTGQFAEQYPAAARALAAAGRVGNHTFDHPDLTTLTDTQIRAEVRAGASEILQVTGHQPAPWFRFPYGARNAHTIAVVNSLGYVPVRWTVDTLGWEGSTGGITAATVLARVVAGERPGEIVLMHLGSNPSDHSTLDADALPAVISALRAAGYGFVTIDALAG